MESDDLDLDDDETLIGPQSILLKMETDSFSENNLCMFASSFR